MGIIRNDAPVTASPFSFRDLDREIERAREAARAEAQQIVAAARRAADVAAASRCTAGA